jgi:hypothetical protein
MHKRKCKKCGKLVNQYSFWILPESDASEILLCTECDEELSTLIADFFKTKKVVKDKGTHV